VVLRRRMQRPKVDLGCSNSRQIGVVARSGHRAGRREAEESSDCAFQLARMAFALAEQYDLAVPVQEVERRPGAIAPGSPGGSGSV